MKNDLALGQVRLPKPPQMVTRNVVVHFANRGLGYEPCTKEAKLAYIKLNIQTPSRPSRAVAGSALREQCQDASVCGSSLENF